MRGIGAAADVPFGIAFFLIGDKALNAGFRLPPPLQDFPIDAQARGLVAHIVYAIATDPTIALLEAVG
jgi:hypothetical protein